MAVIGKSLGRKERWYHRDFDVRSLFEISKSYQEIADRFSQRIPVVRTWICQESKAPLNKSWKWRPLGIAPLAWRVYTRGVNNMLETFIDNGWPSNQHAYKTWPSGLLIWRWRTLEKNKKTKKIQPVQIVLKQQIMDLHQYWISSYDSENKVIYQVLRSQQVWWLRLPKLDKKLSNCEIGSWLETRLDNGVLGKLPRETREWFEKYKSTGAVARLNWRVLHNDPLFATFVAKLFNNSFSKLQTKQDFKLSWKRGRLSIMKLLHRRFGKASFSAPLGGEGLSVFNSTSVCGNLGVRLLSEWSRLCRNRSAARSPMWPTTYINFLKKIQGRRSWTELAKTFHSFEGTRGKSAVNYIPSSWEEGVHENVPFQPYELPPCPSRGHLSAVKNKNRKLLLNGIPWEAVTRSSYSEHELHNRWFGNEIGEKFPRVDWHSLAPREKGTKTQENELVIHQLLQRE